MLWLCLMIVIAQALFAITSLRRYMALPAVPTVPRRLGMPRVSVIVPARNEAPNLGRLLASLLALDYGSYEVIVVDDDSTDASLPVASEFDAIIVRTGGLPPGWTGKNYACHLGALAATGDWLLFTDADTEHAPLSLASILGYALDRQLEAVSVLVGQECRSFWERLLVPFAYQQYFVGVPGAQVNQPRGSTTLANGQYFLIRREAYERLGGHEAVRNSLAEDIRLADRLKSHGVRYGVARAEALVRARAYRGLAEIVTGFSKNSFQYLSLDPRRGAVVVLSVVLASLTPSLISLGLQPAPENDTLLLLAGYSYAFLALGLMGWDRLFRVPAWYGLLQPFSALAFVIIAVRSALRSLLGRGVVWKGRVYGKRFQAAEPTDTQPHPRSRQRP